MAKDGFGKDWIIENGVPIVHDFGTITLRELHYQLVGLGFPNTMRHYKRVISAMTDARWDGKVSFDQFEDHERNTVGICSYEERDLDTKVASAIEQIKLWMTSYHLMRWSNQPKYVEVWIEKKAQIGVFQDPCRGKGVLLFPCKGYPSLTWLYRAKERFEDAQMAGKEVVILYFGDYDPSGDDIPRSIDDTLRRMGCSGIQFSDEDGNLYDQEQKILLTDEQVRAWGLPPAPTKMTDSRAATWDGIGQVEMDAVGRSKMQGIIRDAVSHHFDDELYKELKDRERIERAEFQKRVKKWVSDYSPAESEDDEADSSDDDDFDEDDYEEYRTD